MVGGLVLSFASTLVAALYRIWLGWPAPYPVASLPVGLGIVGGGKAEEITPETFGHDVRDVARSRIRGDRGDTRARGHDIADAFLPELDDAVIIEQLTKVKGVGVWTVQMFLIFALKRLDVLPVADLGVRSAMKKAYGLPELPKPAEMQKIAESWRPYATVASWYLWRSLDNQGAM